MTFILRDGLLFDATTGSTRRTDIAITGERIAAIGAGLEGESFIDCAGFSVLPGMIDCHVHLMTNGVDPIEEFEAPFSLQFFEATRNMASTLESGITTVRDAGGADLGVKVAQMRGIIAGPRLQISITMISQTGGHNDPWEASGIERTPFVEHPGRPRGVADGVDGVRRKVRELIRAGADVIKIATSGGVLSPRDDPRRSHFREDEVAAIVEEAEAAGIPVMAHAGATDGIKVAVQAGVKSIEHGDFLDDEAIELMLDHGTWLVPTLIAAQGVIDAAAAGAALGSQMLEKAHMVVDRQRESISRAIKAGVRIAFGTDSGVTAHGRNLEELRMLVSCGMTAQEALRSATLPAAQLLGLEAELGSIEPGKRADIVLVEGDPFDLGSLTERITAVYQDGRLVAGTSLARS